MTEREALQEIKKYVEEHGCTFKECFTKSEIDRSFMFCAYWNGQVIDRFYIHNSPIAPPKEIQWLKKLRMLSVSQTDGDSLWLGRLESLERLDIVLRNKQLPESWACASSLHELHLWFSREGEFRTIPSGLRNLKQLNYLSISTASYPIELPDWLSEFTNLEKVILRNCHLKLIPYSLIQMGLPFIIDSTSRKGEAGIFLDGVNLDEGDISLFSQPREIIKKYYEGTRSIIQECKVIFLGDSEVGKSSLIERILHNTYKENTLPTDGVLISKWNTSIDGKPFNLRILDFGGQEIMHAMHRCFLSSHTVYVIVCSSRDDSEIDRDAMRWLENVKTFAPGCPVILALNKEDLNRHASVNERSLKDTNPSLLCVLKTSAKRDEDLGVANLIKEIQKAVPTCINKIKANADMIAVKHELDLMEKDYISYDEYIDICTRHHIMENSLQEGMLNWFKDLGVAYSFSTDLQNLHVLNPEWLTKGIYRLILRTPENGFLTHRTIRETLKTSDPRDGIPEKIYTAQETEFILHVMRAFEISHNLGNGIELIPMKMKKTPPEAIESFSKTDALHLRWKASYLPVNLIHRLMIRKVDELHKNCVWRTGGKFTGYQCTAVAEMNDTTLDLYVTGPYDRRQYMQEFRTVILRILNALNIQAEEMICFRTNGKEGQIAYEDVMQQWVDGMAKIYISKIKEYVSPAQLLHEIYPQPEKEKEIYLSIFSFDNCDIDNVVDGNINYKDMELKAQSATTPSDERSQSVNDALIMFSKIKSTWEDEHRKLKELLKDSDNVSSPSLCDDSLFLR